MMKNKMMVTVAALSVLLTACGGSTATEESKTESATTTSAVTESVSESVTETETEEPAAEPEYDSVDGADVKIFYPSSFEEIDTRLYGGTYGETEQTAYFVFSLDLLYQSNNPDTVFTAADVSEILSYSILTKVREVYPSSESNFSMSVETEEETETLGSPFLYRTGVMHAEEQDESADLHYAAYFGVVPMDVYEIEKVPICWIAFSETDDPKALAELEAIVKNTAEKAEFEVY